jgi:HAD superfamily hydrolase (TIGR01549 family)
VTVPFFRAVIFDWDGTLVDSAEATYRSYVSLFSHFGIRFDRRRFAETYSPAWQRTYRAVGLREELWPEADRRWRKYYSAETNALLPGVHSALERLAVAGLRLGIVSSGERQRVVAELADLQVARFFEVVVCGDDLPFKKPRPEALERAIRELAVRPEEAAYVGDSPEDVEMTKAAGAYAVAIPGGFPNHAALLAAGPQAQARSLEEAVSLILERMSLRSS